jgi:hypothetical protein
MSKIHNNIHNIIHNNNIMGRCKDDSFFHYFCPVQHKISMASAHQFDNFFYQQYRIQKTPFDLQRNLPYTLHRYIPTYVCMYVCMYSVYQRVPQKVGFSTECLHMHLHLRFKVLWLKSCLIVNPEIQA